MTYRSGILTGVIATLLACGAAFAGWRLWVAKPGDSSKSTPAVPATVAKPFKEDEAVTFTITAEAETRLAAEFGEIARQPVRRQRTYGGDVMVPPGRSVIVSAPLAG